MAGSGKTSIALHRTAFLLYHFRDRLSAGNVTILSPNKVFADYISNVISELGEEPIGFEADRNPVEVPDEQWQKRFRAYGSHPVRKRIPMVAEDICQRLESEHIRADDFLP